MAKKNKKIKKNRIHLKKQARWTIAGLLMATAIIIALIPVQNGGVSAINTNPSVDANVPSLEDIVDNSKYGVFSDTDLSIVPAGIAYKGYPLKVASIEPFENTDIISTGEQKNAILTTKTNDLLEYKMYTVPKPGEGDPVDVGYTFTDTSQFFVLSDNLPSSEDDRSLYRIASLGASGSPNTIKTYVGYKNSYDNAGKIPLVEGSVGYCPDAAWNDKYRRIEVTRYKNTYDADGNVTGKEYDKTENYFVCTNNANIEYIANEAFSSSNPDVGEANNIIDLELPASLKQIGNEAFKGQGYLKTITGKGDLNSIGKLAFDGCSSLSSVDFAANCPLVNIGDGAFANTAVSYIPLPQEVSKIGSGVFYGCTKLNDCAGDAVDESSSMIFSNTKDAPSKPIVMGNYVFANCYAEDDPGLINIALDKNIVFTDGSKTYGKGTFANCQNLRTVVMPSSQAVFNYEPDTFAKDHNLLYVRVPDTKSDFKNDPTHPTEVPCIFVTSTNQKMNTKDYKPDMTSDQLEEITQNNEMFSVWGPINTDTSSIHTYAQKYGITYQFIGADGLTHYELTINGYTFEFNQAGEIIRCDPVNSTVSGLAPGKILEIPPKIANVPIVKINPNAFENFKTAIDGYPETVMIPDSIKEIGDSAFKNCDTIKNVYISTSGVKIGTSAFENCDNLESVEFTQTGDGNGETYIGANCFLNDKKLNLCAFRNTSLNSDNINVVNVKEIGTNAFRTGNDKGLTLVGDMRTDYIPYQFAIEPRNKTSAGGNSYITYMTGNPQNLVCKYDTTLGDGSVIDTEFGVLDGKVRLVSYPVADTVVGKDSSDKDITIHDLQEKIDNYNADPENYPQYTVMEAWVVESMKHIALPEGIVTIAKSKSDNNKSSVGDTLMSQLNEPADAKENIGGVDVECDNAHALKSVSFDGVREIPDDSFKNDNNLDTVILSGEIDEIGHGAFAGCDRLETINIGSPEKVIKAIGENAFGGYEESVIPGKRTIYDCCDKLKNVVILGNITDPDLTSNVFYGAKELTSVSLAGDEAQGRKNASKEDPYYWCEDGVIYKYDGTDTVLVECLPGVAQTSIRSDVNEILPSAFENCDKLAIVDLSNCNDLFELPERCFYDCDSLRNVTLSKTCATIGEKAFACDLDNKIARATPLDVTMLSHEIYLDSDSFKDREVLVEGATPLNTVHSYDKTAAQRYTKKMPNVNFESDVYDDVLIRFVYYKDNEPVIDESYWPYKSVPKAPEVPADGRTGYEFTGTWNAQIVEATEFKQYTAQYKPKETPSTTGTTTPSTTGSNTSTTNNTSTNKTTSSSSTTNRSTTSSASSTAKPIIISGAPTPTVPINQGAANASGNGSGSGSGSGSNGGSKVATGNTNVVSTAHGLTNNGKMSATVNGSSDNYVIKITETPEADESAKQALTGAFGSLENIRYMPFDISLYDSTGSQKISPVPEGVTVSVTMPIPDDLVIYGGNNKIASTTGGSLETLQPRFTVIDGVPCMNYTVSHLSPYVVYVDTANLTADGTLDATPKTGDPIHPKWFLCIGLAAVSIFLFLKRDRVRVA